MTSMPKSYSKFPSRGQNPNRNSARRLRSASPRWPDSSAYVQPSVLNIEHRPALISGAQLSPSGDTYSRDPPHSPQPGRPLLFLHPGDGFEPLAFPAAPRRAPLLGGWRLGADGGRAFEEGLHGSSPSPQLGAVVKPSASRRTRSQRRARPATASRQAAATQGEAGPLPPAESQSQRPHSTERAGPPAVQQLRRCLRTVRWVRGAPCWHRPSGRYQGPDGRLEPPPSRWP